FVVAPLAGVPGRWVDDYRNDTMAVGSGLRGCLRGFNTMARFKRLNADRGVSDPATVDAIPVPDVRTVSVPEGSMLGFADSMRLLREWGIAVAPWSLIAGGERVVTPAFSGPYVVKLADVAHR